MLSLPKPKNQGKKVNHHVVRSSKIHLSEFTQYSSKMEFAAEAGTEELSLWKSIQGEGAVAAQVVPVTSCSPSWLLCLSQPWERLEVSVLPLWQLCPRSFQGPGLSCPSVSAALGARRSPASHELCTGKSFIFLSLPRHVLSLNFYVCNPSWQIWSAAW